MVFVFWCELYHGMGVDIYPHIYISTRLRIESGDCGWKNDLALRQKIS